MKTFQHQTFAHLNDLDGLSKDQISEHLELYKGYVERTNALTQEIAEVVAAADKKPLGKDPTYAELTRRMGFEYDGMILHELYFGNLRGGGKKEPESNSMLRRALDGSFGSYEKWLDDFKGIAAMPGVGWVIAYENPHNGWISNHWVTLHQNGHPAGYTPILVMDVWEHAFMRDYKATERAKYVEAFFSNIDWNVVESRMRRAPDKVRDKTSPSAQA